MINECCKDLLSRYSDRLSKQAITLAKASGDRKSVFEEALFRRAQIIVDVMEDLKLFAQEELNK